MNTLFEELDKVLKSKNIEIDCLGFELKNLKKERDELAKKCEALEKENIELKIDVEMYRQNEEGANK